jgi:hypothetical protein
MLSRDELIFYTNRALIGRLSPKIRGVYITFDDNEFRMSFIYDSEPTEDEIEEAEIAMTEVFSHFTNDENLDSIKFIVDKQIVERPKTVDIAGKIWVFRQIDLSDY